MAGTGAGQRGVTRAASWRKKVEEIRQTARFGNFYIPESLAPADVMLDELKRSAGFVYWIESKMAQWADELIPLGETNYDEKGSMQVAPTNEAAWLAVYQNERKHLATVAKMCHDMGIADREIRLAEEQARIMFVLINQAFERIGLTPAQQQRVPQIMPALIRSIAAPTNGKAATGEPATEA